MGSLFMFSYMTQTCEYRSKYGGPWQCLAVLFTVATENFRCSKVHFFSCIPPKTKPQNIVVSFNIFWQRKMAQANYAESHSEEITPSSRVKHSYHLLLSFKFYVCPFKNCYWPSCVCLLEFQWSLVKFDNQKYLKVNDIWEKALQLCCYRSTQSAKIYFALDQYVLMHLLQLQQW